MDTTTESLIPTGVHDFLVQFFSQNLTGTDWQRKVDNLQFQDLDDFLSEIPYRNCIIKAFSLGAHNPPLNVAAIETTHLNTFVHPCLDNALWYIADLHYEYGEVPSKNHVDSNRADGIGFMTNADKFQLAYVEGSRPAAKDEKEIADATKIAHNLNKDFKNRRWLPKNLWAKFPPAYLSILSRLLWYIPSR
ncbi:hypothetical protein BC938DRAFT_482826 [Jimgerdemannia flammicorona]|uniref:Uncharacterized protein n=1 Tax=Jimgerdemannia flammicorona TaxID=994334 RepID=A0A433QD50_9FUNG|nr:hypothetical protein BC938DRAFT_482826 [Jimgerdemannia flammicorona]